LLKQNKPIHQLLSKFQVVATQLKITLE
jgi:hypothetical protein